MTTPSLPIDWWQLRKLHNRTLSEAPVTTPTWPKLRLSSNEFDQGCPISGGCVDYGTIPIKGSPPPPPQSRHVPPIQNFLVPS